MKHILIIIFLLISYLGYTQSQYNYGFQAGYKQGYCYGDVGCVSPVPPATPNPLPGEYGTYNEGYNRGFSMGAQDKQSSTHSNSSSGNGFAAVAPNIMDNLNSYDYQGQVNYDRAEWQKNMDYMNKLIEWCTECRDYVWKNSKWNDNDTKFIKTMDDYIEKMNHIKSTEGFKDVSDWRTSREALKLMYNVIHISIDLYTH